MKKLGLFLMLAAVVSLSSCDKEEETMFVDGDYKAETAEYSHGWITFLEVTISGDVLTVVNWDARQEDGSLKSNATAETYPMDPHPTVWISQLEAKIKATDITTFDLHSVIDGIDAAVADETENVDGVTGATHASHSGYELLDLILEAAKDGDTTTQILSAK